MIVFDVFNIIKLYKKIYKIQCDFVGTYLILSRPFIFTSLLKQNIVNVWKGKNKIKMWNEVSTYEQKY